MVAIQYSLDGGIPTTGVNTEALMMTVMQTGFLQFGMAGAGVMNGKVALEFAVDKLPMVNASKIYCVGHSSAANVALLLAAHEPRIARCIAFAAAYDFGERMSEALEDPTFLKMFPHIDEFVTETSPMNNLSTIDCPLMVFHARDDDNVPFQDAVRFVDAAKRAGRQLVFVTADRGGHYQSMIDEGIPGAIRWLSQ